MKLNIIIWDVSHGTAISAQLPSGEVLMMDCAENTDTGFSPILFTKRIWKQPDLLIVSHPHIDHINDIPHIDRQKPPLFLCPFVPLNQLREGKHGESLKLVEIYIRLANLQRRFSILNIKKRNWGGVEISCFGLQGYQNDINDYSLVSFLKFGSFVFAYSGDLSSNGWKSLIEQEGYTFTSMLQQTNFFVVSHHGRREGFDSVIFDYMPNLKMAFISDKGLQPTSITSSYSRQCKGWRVRNKKTNKTENRQVLTTRNDGTILIEASRNYRLTTITHSF